MRVLHINTERTWRGGEQQTLYLARGQNDRGLPVTVACQPDSPMAHHAGKSGLDVVQIRMRGEADVAAAYKLARLIRKREFDVVHMHTSHAHTIGCLASALARRGVRVVTRRVDFRPIKNVFSNFKYRWGVHKYVAISNAIKQVMTDDGIAADRIAVVHSGIDISRFDSVRARPELRSEFQPDSSQPVIGNVAHMADHKGQRYLIEAVPDVLREFPAAKFVIVGDGELRSDLEARAARLGIEDSVVFAGFRNDVPEILRVFDVFVMSSYLEGLCTSIMDAMATGIPVVASDAGGIPEIVQNEVNGLLVPARKPSTLAEAILRMLNNPKEAAKFARAGRRTVEEKFTVDTMVEGNIPVYDELLKVTPGEGGSQ
jgi:glycosyltransferase involved in cell wall biosynthesis